MKNQFVTDFLTELRRVNAWCLVLALLTAYIASFGLNGYIRNLVFNELNLRQFAAHSKHYVNYEAIHEKFDSDINIVVLGGSVAREAYPDDEIMEERISRQQNKKVTFRDLGSQEQSLLDSMSLLKTLKAPENTFIVLQLSFSSLSKDEGWYANHYFFPIMLYLDMSEYEGMSPKLYRIVRNLLPDILTYRRAIQYYLGLKECNAAMFWKKSARDFCFREVDVQRKWFFGESIDDERMDAKIKKIRAQRLKPAKKNHRAGLEHLRHIVNYCREKKYRLIIIEYPYAPRARALAQEGEPLFDYSNKVKSTIGDTSLLDLRFHPDIQDGDVVDAMHMNESGKEKMSDIFLKELKEAL